MKANNISGLFWGVNLSLTPGVRIHGKGTYLFGEEKCFLKPTLCLKCFLLLPIFDGKLNSLAICVARHLRSVWKHKTLNILNIWVFSLFFFLFSRQLTTCLLSWMVFGWNWSRGGRGLRRRSARWSKWWNVKGKRSGIRHSLGQSSNQLTAYKGYYD